MKILGIIPARGGSKGVPQKNIKPLNGRPLFWYTIQSARESALLSRVILSTDSQEIAETGKQYGVEAPFIRPPHLADDSARSVDVVKHALDFYKAQGEQYDAVCLLQPTYPFREKGLIDNCLQKFINNKYDCLITVLKVPHQFNPHWIFEEDKDGRLKISTGEDNLISRRQELPEAYYRDGALYAATASYIYRTDTLTGGNMGYYLTDYDHYVNIDTPADFGKAELMAKKLA